MDHSYKVSIITVVLNAPEALEKTILSVTGQTFADKEFIVIDGGSTDNTKTIIEKYHDRISKTISEPDHGPFDAMNKGLSAATGEWVIFMNAGDLFYSPEILSIIFSGNLANNLANVDVIYGNSMADYLDFRIFKKAGLVHDLWKGMLFSHQAVAVRTAYVKEKGFQTEYSIGADYDLFCRLASEKKEFLYLNETIAQFEAFGISHRKMLASGMQHYRIIRQYQDLSFSMSLFHAVKLCTLAFAILAYKIFPGKFILLLIRQMNKKNLVPSYSNSKDLPSRGKTSYPGSAVSRIANYGRSKMNLFRTFRLKLIVAKILYLIRLINGTLKSIQEPPLQLPSTNQDASIKIGMIDNSYHSKTISSFFFIELLKDHSSLEIFWDTQWNGGRIPGREEMNERNFDLVLIWQVFLYYKPAYLRKLNCRKVVIIPMYDDAHAIPDHFFLKYREFTFISFSRHFHERFEKLGIKSACFQYYIDPATLPEPKEDFTGLKGFFWQRNNDITWEHIKKLIEGTGFTAFHIHLAIDPLWYKEVLPSVEDMNSYNITISRWFDKKEEYLECLSRANVFFTPRLYEGIGMPFIEAMTMGMVVVAPDHPTMNEYITHGETGLLYDRNDLRPLNFTTAKAVASRAREHCIEGYNRWKHSQPELLKWLELQQKQDD